MWNQINLDVDIKKKNYLNTEVNQADDLYFCINLYDNGQPLSLIDGDDTVIVNYVNANNTITGDNNILKSFDDNSNKLRLYCPRNCTNSAGTAKMQVTINKNNQYTQNKQTTSFPIEVKVNKSIVDGQEVSQNVNSIIGDLNNATLQGQQVINNITETATKYPTSSQLYADVERLKSREYNLLSSTYDILLQPEGLYKGLNLINAPKQESIIYYYDVKAWGDNYKRIDAYRCTLDETYTNIYKNNTWTGWVNNRDRIKLTSGNDILYMSEGKYQGVCKNSPVSNSDFYYNVIEYRDNPKYKKIIAHSIYSNAVYENIMTNETWSGWQSPELQAFPVGSIKLSNNNTNPGTYLLGSTWTLVGQGLTLVGVGTGKDSNGISKTFTAGNNAGKYQDTNTHDHSLVGVSTVANVAGNYIVGNSNNVADTTITVDTVNPSYGVYIWLRTA